MKDRLDAYAQSSSEGGRRPTLAAFKCIRVYKPSKSISEHGFGGYANADWAVIADVAHSSMMAAKTRAIIRMVSSSVGLNIRVDRTARAATSL